tara:strand:- start:334 stop:1791 length:1458 start_codon:yes stop_codon:yes gene_type:complete
MPIIIPANSAISGGFDVSNSVRLNAADNPSMAVTQGTPTNVDKYTFSVWVKRADIGAANSKIFSVTSGSTYGEEKLEFNQDDLIWRQTDTSGNTSWERVTDRKFKDPGGWYHIVVAYDSSQGTAGNRCKMYINGVQQTSFSGSSDPSSNQDSYTNTSGRSLKFFALQSNLNSQNAGAYFSEMVYVDGQQLGPTSFGEFDSSSDVWRAIDVSGLTFGDNGFYCEFKNSGALGADTSGNSNNLSVTNIASTDQSLDVCTNNAATMSTVTWYDGTKTNGGLTISTDQTSYRYQTATIGVSSGKWYWELKLSTASNYALMGITDAPAPVNVGTNWILGSGAYAYSVVYNTAGGNGNKYNNAGTSPSNTPGAFMGAFSAGDIIMFALDCDNNTLKIGANNSWSNGTGSTNQTFSNTTVISITASASTNTGFYFPAVGDYGGGASVFDFNFSSPPYAVSSGNTDADGYGNFEYEVPSGYFAVNTKNLAEYG